MKHLLILSFFSLCLTSCVSYSGTAEMNRFFNEQKAKYPVPDLSKAEMYADFDTLLSIMERCNPQYLVRKKAIGYDMIAEMKAQREQIQHCNTTLEFVNLLNQTFVVSLDWHCRLYGMSAYFFRDAYHKKDVKICKIKKRDFGINFHYYDDVVSKQPKIFRLIHIQGKYFLKNTTTLFNGKDSVTFPLGTEILTFNQQPVRHILSTVRNSGTYWDFNSKTYNSSYLAIPDTQNRISFRKDNTVQDYVFTAFSQIEDDGRKRIWEGKYQVKWLEKDSVVLITVPAMSYRPDWLEQLKSEILRLRDKPIRAVVMDVRGNWGGNDNTWMDILGMISPTSLREPFCYISCTDKEVVKRVQTSKKEFKGKNITRTFDFVDEHYAFKVHEEGMDSIKNGEQNLGYEGIIYLLVDKDIYSSTGALTSLSTKNDRIKTIGMSTGRLLGRGATPSIFILPHSRVIFSMELLLDAAGVSDAEDFYHDKVTYPLTPSIEYYKYWYDPARAYMIDEKTMYERDEVFVKALEIIRAEK